jgi:hypothetical protein
MLALEKLPHVLESVEPVFAREITVVPLGINAASIGW